MAAILRYMCVDELKKRDHMPWNDQVFRDAVEQAAQAIGKSRTAVLQEAGIGKGALNYEPSHGRVIDVFERLMPILGWTPADVLRIIAEAFDWSTETVIHAVPHAPARRGRLRARMALIAAAASLLRDHGNEDEDAELDEALGLVGAVVRAVTDRQA